MLRHRTLTLVGKSFYETMPQPYYLILALYGNKVGVRSTNISTKVKSVLKKTTG